MTLTRSISELDLLLALTKYWLVAAVFVLFGASLCRAQGTFTAASCSQSDVNAVINGPTHIAVNGDTIIIPPGTCTWTSGITVAGKGIVITGTGTPNTGAGTFGAGAANTTLIDHASGALFSFAGLPFGQTAQVELLQMSASGAGTSSIDGALKFSGNCTASGCPQVRVDNITFTAGTWYGPIGGGLILVDNVFGVADHNTTSEPAASAFFLDQVSFDAWQGVGTWGDNSFASADTFGTPQAWFMENNSLNNVRLTDNDVSPGASSGGARYVCRFNHVTNMQGDGLCGAHGTAWGGRFRGQRQVEVYYNTLTATICNSVNSLLSGTGYFLSNTITGTGCNVFTDIEIARFQQTGTPWNSCDGTQPWDQVPFTSTSDCLDMPGRGRGTGLQNLTPVQLTAPGTPCTTAGQCWPNPALDPVYEAGEVSPNHVGIGGGTHLVANRDYYGQVSDVAQTSATSPFNGTSGTGYGTLARQPTSCTKGVGYWATDQGTWNNGGPGGVLNFCLSTNVWSTVGTGSYVPYTYPHPLTAGGTTTTGQNPSPPTNLIATVE